MASLSGHTAELPRPAAALACEPCLRVQFNLNAAQYSHLLSAFLFGYTAMQVFAGWIVDRTGARLGLVLAML